MVLTLPLPLFVLGVPLEAVFVLEADDMDFVSALCPLTPLDLAGVVTVMTRLRHATFMADSRTLDTYGIWDLPMMVDARRQNALISYKKYSLDLLVSCVVLS